MSRRYIGFLFRVIFCAGVTLACTYLVARSGGAYAEETCARQAGASPFPSVSRQVGGGAEPTLLSIPVGVTTAYTVHLPLVVRERPALVCSGGLLVDDFSDPGSGWPVGWDSGFLMAYVEGEYQIQSTGSYAAKRVFNGWSAQTFRVGVDARLPSAVDISPALFFGQSMVDGVFEFYMFEINVDAQTYRFTRWTPSPEDVKDWEGNSLAIKPGTAINRLEVERRGSTIVLFINGEEVAEISDGMFVGERLVGLGVDGGSYSVLFDNFELCIGEQ